MNSPGFLSRSLVELNLPPVGRSLVKQAIGRASDRGVQLVDRATDGYVSLAPGSDLTVAAYVHRDRLSVALEQALARQVVLAHPQLDLDARQGPGAAGYVVATWETIDRHGLREVVAELIDDAIDRSQRIGPRNYGRRGAGRPEPAPARFCPSHPGIALPASGVCNQCE